MNKEVIFRIVKTFSINVLGIVIAFIGASILFEGQSIISSEFIRCIVCAVCFVYGAKMMNKELINEKEKAKFLSNYALNYVKYKFSNKQEDCQWTFEEDIDELKEIRNYIDLNVNIIE